VLCSFLDTFSSSLHFNLRLGAVAGQFRLGLFYDVFQPVGMSNQKPWLRITAYWASLFASSHYVPL